MLFMSFNVAKSEKSQSEANNEESLVKCGRFPEEKDIFVDNLIWQVLETPRGFVKLLNAYLDMRFNMTLVRVNVNSYNLNITVDALFCQFWFEDDTGPYVVKATEYILMWFRGLNFLILDEKVT